MMEMYIINLFLYFLFLFFEILEITMFFFLKKSYKKIGHYNFNLYKKLSHNKYLKQIQNIEDY